MHSEHLTNLHPGWVVGGWLVAIAVASAVFMVGVGLGIVPPEAEAGWPWVALAIAVGFFAGGFFVGLRWSDAPIIHGAAITILTVLVWFVGSVMVPGPLTGGEAPFVLGMVLVQLVAAVGGGALGRHLVRRGETPSLEP